MNKKLLFPLFLTVFVFKNSYGQTLQWASKVEEFSSELTPNQYSAQQILGKPDVLPATGQSPNAWAPDKPKRKEFIKIGFATPIEIQQIAIAESSNPGALFKITAYEANGKEHVIQNLSPQAIPLNGRMLNIFFEKTTYKVASVRLDFDGAVLSDLFSIDAVAITDSKFPIAAIVNVSELIAKGLVTEHLDENVNSESNEVNGYISPDGKVLYFSRQNHPGNIGGINDKEDIWYSTLDSNGKWTPAQNMGPKFNNKYPNFVNSISSVSPDGKAAVMLLGNQYINGGKKMSAGISISNNINGVWTEPKPVQIENEYNYNEKADYFLTNSRQALLMSIQGKDSFGDRDIYVSFPKNDSLWSEPMNLGKNINTPAEESGPFIASDGKTLYFSSKGYSGYGGSDIYRSVRQDSTWTKWSNPENLGPEINSKFDDSDFNIPSESEYAYYSRGINEDNTDIFRLKIPVFMKSNPVVLVTGKITDATTGEPLDAKITYVNLATGKEIGQIQSNPKTGEYEFSLPVGNIYGVRAIVYDQIYTCQDTDLKKVTYGSINRDIRLKVERPPIFITGNLLDAKTDKPLEAKIIYVDPSTGKEIGQAQSNPITGGYQVSLPYGKEYEVQVIMNDQIYPSENLDLKKVTQSSLTKDIRLRTNSIDGIEIAENTVVKLDFIFFASGKAELNPQSYRELNAVVSLMEQYPAMKAEIAGHSDATGSDENNLKLSESRAKAVSAYLIRKGIAKKRISVTFFGSSRPVDTTHTKSGDAKNRRVEFKIIKI